MTPLHLTLFLTLHGCILALNYSPSSPSFCPSSQQVTTTNVTFTLNDVKVVTSTIQSVHIVLSTKTKFIGQTPQENTIVLFNPPTTLEVTKTVLEHYTVNVLQPYVSWVFTPVTTTMLEAITRTSTNTLQFLVSETRAWHRSVHQKVYRSTLTTETRKASTCSEVVMTHITHDITFTADIIVTSTTTTTSYTLETFTTTLRGEGAYRCVVV